MSEKVIPENLSGAEIRTAIAKAVDNVLRDAGGIRDIDSYSVFRCRVNLKVELHDVGGIREVEVDTSSNIGQVPAEEDPDQYLEQFEQEFEMAEEPPNQVRMDAELPIPVATTENGKPVTKYKKYERKAKK